VPGPKCGTVLGTTGKTPGPAERETTSKSCEHPFGRGRDLWTPGGPDGSGNQGAERTLQPRHCSDFEEIVEGSGLGGEGYQHIRITWGFRNRDARQSKNGGGKVGDAAGVMPVGNLGVLSLKLRGGRALVTGEITGRGGIGLPGGPEGCGGGYRSLWCGGWTRIGCRMCGSVFDGEDCSKKRGGPEKTKTEGGKRNNWVCWGWGWVGGSGVSWGGGGGGGGGGGRGGGLVSCLGVGVPGWGGGGAGVWCGFQSGVGKEVSRGVSACGRR